MPPITGPTLSEKTWIWNRLVDRGVGSLVVGPGVDAVRLVGDLGDRPLLVAHGTADTIVPVHHASRIADAARMAGVGVEVVIVDGAGHNDWPMTHAQGVDAVVSFFRETLVAER